LGSLRFILALLVVGSHLGAFGGATFAVKAFFIISGFYMALVIDTRYHKLPVASFYASRMLRLLPLYWVVGVLTLISEFFLVPAGQMMSKMASPLFYAGGLGLSSLPIIILIYAGVSDVTMLGLDTGQWLGFNRLTGQLSLAPVFGPDATSVMGLSPVPQGWSVGLELLFYLIAPFVIRRSIWFLASLCALSLASRIALMAAGFSGNPWDRTLFPSELIYFLLGVLAYRLYLELPHLKLSPRMELGLAAMVLGVTVIYWPVDHVIHGSLVWETVPYILVAAGMPFLFKLSKDISLDASIGELSYPIYMGHGLIIGLLLWSPLNTAPFIGSGWPRHVLTIVLVIAGAFLLDRLVVLPIDRLRIRFGAKKRIDLRVRFASLISDSPSGMVGRWPARRVICTVLKPRPSAQSQPDRRSEP
jgi:peptidoglycan/LPS O-acetylase OafA/YrhL